MATGLNAGEWFLLGAPWDCSATGRGEAEAPRALRAAGLAGQPDGPDWDQLAALLLPLARSPRLIGISVADFRPDLDPDGDHARRIVALLDRVLP